MDTFIPFSAPICHIQLRVEGSSVDMPFYNNCECLRPAKQQFDKELGSEAKAMQRSLFQPVCEAAVKSLSFEWKLYFVACRQPFWYGCFYLAHFQAFHWQMEICGLFLGGYNCLWPGIYGRSLSA
jgi:hypothetical protein